MPETAAQATAAGYDPSKGTLSLAMCPVAPLFPGLLNVPFWLPHEVFTLNGQDPAAPPPDPVELAQSAAARITVPAPTIHVGSPTTQVAVKVPVWLWVDQQPAVTATVSGGGLTVTAKAVLTSTDWSMGDPTTDPDKGSSATVPSFTCQGPGTAQPAGVSRAVAPPCGYTYIWRSTPERTGGVGAWPVTVTAHWTLTWTATNGAQGTIALQAHSTQAVTVGQWQVELVAGPGSDEPDH